MEGFRIDLKTFLGLATMLPNCQKVNISSWFLGDNLGPKFPSLHDPYIIYSTTVLYDIHLCICKNTYIHIYTYIMYLTPSKHKCIHLCPLNANKYDYLVYASI